VTGLDGLLAPGPTRLVGVLNVTPDSFFDGGRYVEPDLAVARGLELARHGADLVDVGGESTRPGAGEVPATEEIERIGVVVERLAAAGVTVSVDTTKALVAEAAIQAGAVLVNDVSGGLADPHMLPLIAARGVACVLQHWRGPLGGDGSPADYDDVVAEVMEALEDRIAAATAAGVPRDHIVIDPGLGFSKKPADNWALVRSAARLNALGWPVLWGASRKRFLAEAYDGDPGPEGRQTAGLTVTGWLASKGAWGVRVHDVAAHLRVVRAVELIQGEPWRGSS
jgi:dihydropteroate synthase